MNYASLYNMRSCFTVKRGGDPRDPWHRLRRLCRCGVARGGHCRRRGYSGIDREGNISRINFAIGEFYVRAGSIYYERALAATRTPIPPPPRFPPTAWFLGLRLFASSLGSLCEIADRRFRFSFARSPNTLNWLVAHRARCWPIIIYFG